jgi:ketosteroid isomerase-like protein
MTAAQIARDFLSSFYSGDRPAARALLAASFDFTGPFVALRGADAFLESAGPLLALTTGHAVIRSWCDGDDVCVIHEVTLRGATEPITMADWLTVRGGQVATERVIFDAARLRAALATG